MTYITDAAYKNILAVSTTHTSAQNAGAWGQTDAIDGSTVTYEPVSSSSKIIYKISFYADSQSRTNMYSIAIQESTNSGASWTTINNAYNRMFGMASTGVSSGQDQRWYMNSQFILPSWSGQKMLRVIIQGQRPWVTDADLHIITDWDGSSSTRYCNTNVLVHEV
tara:strand:- start:55 stop:549 length:495 start_codon:yes stop_codon:yes gene_type:complete